MKEKVKTILTVVLVCCFCAWPLSVCAAADVATPGDALPAEEETAETQIVCATVADIATMILDPKPFCEIQVGPAVLETEDGAQDVYLVALRGATVSVRKTNDVIACLLSAFNLTSKYYTLVKNAVLEYVPEGAKIVFAGHSLGGMIEQQLSCSAEITDRYEIVNTLNFGSPYVLADATKREGPLVRFAEKTDVIPRLSPAVITNPKAYNDMTVKDGGYLFDPDGAHNKSYMRDDLFGGYDVLGVPDGGARLVIDCTALTRLQA